MYIFKSFTNAHGKMDYDGYFCYNRIGIILRISLIKKKKNEAEGPKRHFFFIRGNKSYLRSVLKIEAGKKITDPTFLYRLTQLLPN
jgi:hypothetical protein